ncbi:MAG: prepilin-type N-terminal cleavage/methylation domain-containing protein [Verrucomicrobia bacterium]|nr:prepilin-type N-terminal cleavage/methylation domain-containing protein [Verrucomicrobiota bacterium]
MTITTDQSRNRKARRGGFTLVEMMITMGLLTMIIAIGLSAVTFISQSSTSLTNYTMMSKNSRNALEEIARDLRMGYNINSATSTKLDFNIFGKAGTTQRIVYEYTANDKTLTRKEDTFPVEIVLENLTNFQFNYFNLRREATTAPISIKEVQMEGIMKRRSLAITNTNYVISARFMMRNRAVSN